MPPPAAPRMADSLAFTAFSMLRANGEVLQFQLMHAAAEQLFFEGKRHLAARDAQRARACYRRAVAIAPGLAEAHAGKSLLIVHEGGYGDMIQFSRYAAILKHGGARRITLVAPPALQTLLAAVEGIDDVLPSDAAIARSEWDFWVSLMSLPHLCATRADSIPAGLPYVHADRDAVARWRPTLPAPGTLVGVVCKGNPKFENDEERSIASFATLAPLADVDGVNFVDLQIGEPQAAPAALDSKLLHPGHRVEPFADTAAIVDSLDLVICVDTAIAHLAGAMGKPCWVLLPWHMPDWRWLAERSDSPWYPGAMRLFRQPARGDWTSVIARVRSALDEFVASGRRR